MLCVWSKSVDCTCCKGLDGSTVSGAQKEKELNTAQHMTIEKDDRNVVALVDVFFMLLLS
jgi:hypothetical protein